MTEHNLKILPEHFAPVEEGIKTAELRNNDRNFKVGDILHLCEIESPDGWFTGAYADRLITHIADVGAYMPGFVLLSMIPYQRPADEDAEF